MTTREGHKHNHDLASFLLAMPEERRAALRDMVRGGRGGSQTEAPAKVAAAGPTPALPGLSAAEAERIVNALLPTAKPRPAQSATPPAQDASTHFVRLSTVEPVALHWRSPGRIAAGKITILDGDPGLGKSTLLCELVARVTRGEPLPGGEREEPRGVILLSAEDDLHDTIRPRLDAAGGDPRRVISLVSVPDNPANGRPFVVPGDGWILEDMARRLDAALIIIDPLVAYLHGGISANSDQDVRRALAELKGVGERTGAAIVAVRHLNKSVGGNPLYRGGGSIGIIGAARCGLLLAPDPDDPERRILAATKGNLGKLPPSLAFRLVEDRESGVARVAWDGETRWTAAQLLQASEAAGEQRAPGQLAAARSWLREALAAGPRPATAMQTEAEAHGYSKGTLVRARSAEGIVARKASGRDGGWTWALPAVQGEESQAAGAETLATLATLATLPLSNGSESSQESSD